MNVEKYDTEKPCNMKDLVSERVLEDIHCLKFTVSKSIYAADCQSHCNVVFFFFFNRRGKVVSPCQVCIKLLTFDRTLSLLSLTLFFVFPTLSQVGPLGSK